MPLNSNRAMATLRLVLGLVVLWQSCVFVFSTRAATGFARTGLPDKLRIILGSCEIVAAVLFLVPATVIPGALSLLAVFVFAVGLHVLHGEYDVGVLVVYMAATVAVLAHRRASLERRVTP
jgi:DoxX-like family